MLFELVLCDFSLQEGKERKIPPRGFCAPWTICRDGSQARSATLRRANCYKFTGCVGHGFRLTKFFYFLVRRCSVGFAAPGGGKLLADFRLAGGGEAIFAGFRHWSIK
jgi:hypothetical protein